MSSWRDNVRNVEPYTPGEQPKELDVIKLNTNENPYPPSPKVLEAMENIKNLRKYPDPAAAELVDAIADYHGFTRDEVFVGVGSDDVLAIAFLTFFNGKKPVLFPDITYSFYPVWADLFQIPYETKPLDGDFNIIPEDYYGENGGIVFPNPNAPTGAMLSLDAVEDIIKYNQDVVVIVDEAYIDFGGTTAKELTRKYENLLVVQTYSKSRSLAGLRIGYAIGNKELIKAMNDVKYSYNSYTMNEPSIIMGKAVLEDEAYFQETRKKIIETREWFKEEMKKLGFSFADSMANFIFATHKTVPAEELFAEAKKNKIYVRYFKKPRIDNYLRITIGTREEMEALLQFFKDYIK
ncbi:histidinol-phosphate transaminase [Anaerostipes faecalis]|uniref:histidinol-phosphate transaminase n=1 Tax=Anaerostipes faecalis TaxID=2738446 RepID=UPI001C1DEB27|nr:histidinol-phosphate transaminase [Anaerostipes faecalis]